MRCMGVCRWQGHCKVECQVGVIVIHGVVGLRLLGLVRFSSVAWAASGGGQLLLVVLGPAL